MWHHKISSPQRVSEFSTFVFFSRLLTKHTIVFLFIDIMNYTNDKLIALDANSEFKKITLLQSNIGLLLWYDGNSVWEHFFVMWQLTRLPSKSAMNGRVNTFHMFLKLKCGWSSKYPDFECNFKLNFFCKNKKVAFCPKFDFTQKRMFVQYMTNHMTQNKNKNTFALIEKSNTYRSFWSHWFLKWFHLFYYSIVVALSNPIIKRFLWNDHSITALTIDIFKPTNGWLY